MTLCLGRRKHLKALLFIMWQSTAYELLQSPGNDIQLFLNAITYTVLLKEHKKIVTYFLFEVHQIIWYAIKCFQVQLLLF